MELTAIKAATGQEQSKSAESNQLVPSEFQYAFSLIGSELLIVMQEYLHDKLRKRDPKFLNI